MLPLTLLGVGHSTVHEVLGARQILSDHERLGRAGLVEADRAKVEELAKQGRDEEASAALQEAWPRRDAKVAGEFQRQWEQQQMMGAAKDGSHARPTPEQDSVAHQDGAASSVADEAAHSGQAAEARGALSLYDNGATLSAESTQFEELARRLGRSFPSRPDRFIPRDTSGLPHLRVEGARQREELDRMAVKSPGDGRQRVGHGGEHEVSLSADGRMAIKETLPDGYGFVATEDTSNGSPTDELTGLRLRPALPSEYMLRQAIIRHVFGVPIKLLRVAKRPSGAPVIETEMPWIKGDTHPEEADITKFMEDHGFVKVDDKQIADPQLKGITWYRAVDHLLATDAKPQNFKVNPENGDIVPLDLIVGVHPLNIDDLKKNRSSRSHR